MDLAFVYRMAGISRAGARYRTMKVEGLEEMGCEVTY